MGEKDFSEDFGKKVFGFLTYVRIGETKEVVLRYSLPEGMTGENYKLLIQKQSGTGVVPAKVIFIDKTGRQSVEEFELSGDREIKF